MKYVKMIACAVVVASFLMTGIACQKEAKEPQQMQLFGSVQKSPNGIIIMSEIVSRGGPGSDPDGRKDGRD